MAPENVMIDCSLGDDGVPTNGDTCTVTCNNRFTLRGDATRTCQIMRRRIRWRGDEARCVKGMHPLHNNNLLYCHHKYIKDIICYSRVNYCFAMFKTTINNESLLF